MDSEKITDINMDIHNFWMSVPLSMQVHVDIHIDIQAGISMQGHPSMDIRKTINIHERISMFLWIAVFNYPCFHGYPFGYPWIYGHPCIDLLWILDPGLAITISKRSRRVLSVDAVINRTILKITNLYSLPLF